MAVSEQERVALQREQRELMQAQMRIADQINRSFPRPAGQERSPYEIARDKALGEQSNANAVRWQEIRDLLEED